jgi:UDP-sulfoquinovose synthase
MKRQLLFTLVATYLLWTDGFWRIEGGVGSKRFTTLTQQTSFLQDTTRRSKISDKGRLFSLTPSLQSSPFSASTKKKVVVLGGDGFCGWPTSLFLSEKGHDVVIVDNLARRKIDVELGCSSLTPIVSIEQRCKVWKKLTGNSVRYRYLDVAADYSELLGLLNEEAPDVVIHFAEQRAAPYSMKDSRRKRYTVNNNVCGTNNLLAAVVESGLDIHIVHLGTMGVYGYHGSAASLEEIPEGTLFLRLPTILILL